MSADSRFNLLNSYAAWSLVSISLVSLVCAYGLSSFLEHQLMQREAAITQELVQSVADLGRPESYFHTTTQPRDIDALQSFFEKVSHLPNVLRANVYSYDKVVLWSNDTILRGRRFANNDELDEALAGELSFHFNEPNSPEKSEHVFLEQPERGFVEYYLPVWNSNRDVVLGAVELYRSPEQLFASLDKGRQMIWAFSIGSAVFLFATLFWIVRQGQAVISAQQRRLVVSETNAAIGQLSMAVAHSIRNPLAAIRSSAELCMENDISPDTRECVEDIVAESDRLNKWLEELLVLARIGEHDLKELDLRSLVDECLVGFARSIARNQIDVTLDLGNSPVYSPGDEALLSHMLNSVFSNAIEAMPGGGRLIVKLDGGERVEAGRYVSIVVTDTGPGIDHDAIEQSFKTTKKDGLGFGLQLIRRVLERHRGDIEFRRAPESGTEVKIRLPAGNPAPRAGRAANTSPAPLSSL